MMHVSSLISFTLVYKLCKIQCVLGCGAPTANLLTGPEEKEEREEEEEEKDSVSSSGRFHEANKEKNSIITTSILQNEGRVSLF
jgi:hypothetical protein